MQSFQCFFCSLSHTATTHMSVVLKWWSLARHTPSEFTWDSIIPVLKRWSLIRHTPSEFTWDSIVLILYNTLSAGSVQCAKWARKPDMTVQGHIVSEYNSKKWDGLLTTVQWNLYVCTSPPSNVRIAAEVVQTEFVCARNDGWILDSVGVGTPTMHAKWNWQVSVSLPIFNVIEERPNADNREAFGNQIADICCVQTECLGRQQYVSGSRLIMCKN